MWATTFESRLLCWADLRTSCADMDRFQCLQHINTWWHETPWTSYYLHWDDQTHWPDPWQLLEDNIYCNVARALGMLYTITMLDRTDMQDAIMVDNGNDNLVLVEDGKYILNWSRDCIVNISPGHDFGHIFTQDQAKQKIH